ncbi:hypothetical protein CI238_11764 [Colletotrichum incanum]|uniref:Uncharacterized protein n=1 Tax=Colletotrichum incanum TaxID=1573173 RepID=A0A167DQJ4_COLIC|nr:hypothetical protein CI238_11764 [Colletotrichum incanum]
MKNKIIIWLALRYRPLLTQATVSGGSSTCTERGLPRVRPAPDDGAEKWFTLTPTHWVLTTLIAILLVAIYRMCLYHLFASIWIFQDLPGGQLDRSNPYHWEIG